MNYLKSGLVTLGISTILLPGGDLFGANPLKKMIEEDPMMGMEVMKKLASIYFNRLNELRTGISNFFKVFKFKKM